MKLIAELNDEKHEVEVKRDGEKLLARVDTREYELTASEVEPDVYLFKHDNRVFQIYVSPGGIVNVGNRQLEVTVSDPRRLRGSTGSDGQADGLAEIKTAMPGKVVNILVEVGSPVEKGDGVIVVEAMKMQNEMKAPKQGVVKEIRVATGATVNAGDVLVVIE